MERPIILGVIKIKQHQDDKVDIKYGGVEIEFKGDDG